MIRMDKKSAARLGFMGVTADRHTADRIYKKNQTRKKQLDSANKPAKTPATLPNQDALDDPFPLKRVGARWVVDLNSDEIQTD